MVLISFHPPAGLKSEKPFELSHPLNQQKFSFSLDGEENDVPVVRASTKRGAFTQMDLGIAQCHFEIGAGNVLYRWSE